MPFCRKLLGSPQKHKKATSCMQVSAFPTGEVDILVPEPQAEVETLEDKNQEYEPVSMRIEHSIDNHNS